MGMCFQCHRPIARHEEESGLTNNYRLYRVVSVSLAGKTWEGENNTASQLWLCKN